MNDYQDGFSVQDAMAVQGELRRTLGLAAETFPVAEFIGMLSDEIEQFRGSGRTDADVAAVIRHVTGREISPDDIARYYASPADRGHGPDAAT